MGKESSIICFTTVGGSYPKGYYSKFIETNKPYLWAWKNYLNCGIEGGNS